MKLLQDQLGRPGLEDVQLVTLTVDPDFDTPEHIKRAAIEAIERGETK